MACILFCPFFCSFQFAVAELQITGVKCEYLSNPLGIDVVKPGLSWQLKSDENGERQRAYQVIVASTLDNLAPHSR